MKRTINEEEGNPLSGSRASFRDNTTTYLNRKNFLDIMFVDTIIVQGGHTNVEWKRL